MHDYWRAKKVLVTGASGFVGQNLMNRLNHMKKEIPFTLLGPSHLE